MRKIEKSIYFSKISCAFVSKVASKNLKILYTYWISAWSSAVSFMFIPGMAFIVQSYGNHEQASTAMLFTYKFSCSLPLLTASLSKVVFQKTCKKIPCRRVHVRSHLLRT